MLEEWNGKQGLRAQPGMLEKSMFAEAIETGMTRSKEESIVI